VPALEPLRGIRVVANPAALDGAIWEGERLAVLRFAPDDALGLGAAAVTVEDADAIVETEVGFVGAWLPVDEIARHIEWALPLDRPALAQGNVAGVPAKVWLPDRHRNALLIAMAAHAHDLAERLR
jgi:hypothetical protein